MIEQSEEGVRFITKFEGWSAAPYRDSRGIPTIGYGNTYYEDGSHVKMDDPAITRDRGAQILRHACRNLVYTLGRLIHGHVSLSQGKVDALISFMYNAGPTAFASSTILRTINADGPEHVTREMFTRWDKIHDPRTGELHESSGLLRRRNAEFDLYRS
jgi:lysozyme